MKKDDIKTLIVVIIVCAVCLALVFILSRKKNIDTLKPVEEYNTYFSVTNYMNSYISYLANNDREAIYNMLSSEYIYKNNINQNNILNIVKTYNQDSMISLKITSIDEIKIKNDKYNLLTSYIDEVVSGDKTNREGHAAKVYFNALFGKDFVRNNNDNINAALNYGYAILLSTINKEVIAGGYLTQLGIHHKNEFNEFNLSCDLMEPFRVIVDNFVYFNQERELNTNYKLDIVNILNNSYKYQNKSYTLKDIIGLFVKNTLNNINNTDEYKDFIYYEG